LVKAHNTRIGQKERARGCGHGARVKKLRSQTSNRRPTRPEIIPGFLKHEETSSWMGFYSIARLSQKYVAKWVEEDNVEQNLLSKETTHDRNHRPSDLKTSA